MPYEIGISENQDHQGVYTQVNSRCRIQYLKIVINPAH